MRTLLFVYTRSKLPFMKVSCSTQYSTQTLSNSLHRVWNIRANAALIQKCLKIHQDISAAQKLYALSIRPIQHSM